MADVRNLNIVSCEVGFNGSNYTIYNVKADGVTAKLNAFSQLPLGDGEFTVTPYKKDGETIYTLAPIDGAGSKTDTLRVDLDALTEVVTDLKTRLKAIEGRFDGIGNASQPEEEDIPF